MNLINENTPDLVISMYTFNVTNMFYILNVGVVQLEYFFFY